MIDIVVDVLAGVWVAGGFAVIWYVRTRSFLAEDHEDRDLREWLDGQV
ncbi:hypothetical protein [Mesorhizobium escarrei]|nr:hypothetical protein [Mesorhizobium escarrei]